MPEFKNDLEDAGRKVKGKAKFIGIVFAAFAGVVLLLYLLGKIS